MAHAFNTSVPHRRLTSLFPLHLTIGTRDHGGISTGSSRPGLYGARRTLRKSQRRILIVDRNADSFVTCAAASNQHYRIINPAAPSRVKPYMSMVHPGLALGKSVLGIECKRSSLEICL